MIYEGKSLKLTRLPKLLQTTVSLEEPLFPDTSKKILGIFESLLQQGLISQKQYSYLVGSQPPRPRYFYLLPKIHKPADKWIVPHRMPPGRPIVSDCGSESYGAAEYLDFFFSPLSKLHPSYIRDTQHFLDNIQNIRIKEPCFLFTMDVASLYTNIEIPLGMAAIKRCLEAHLVEGRPDKELLELLHLNLTLNDFEFNGSYYLQVKGTAMGKRFAPAYANIYMTEWEQTVFQKCRKLPQHYFRYLDDIWEVGTHLEEDFQNFVEELNSHHASIRVEPTISKTAVDFLDTTTFKGPDFEQTGILATKVFFKPTDTHALLHKHSHHPKHVFRGIVKSQLLRLLRFIQLVFYCEVYYLGNKLSKYFKNYNKTSYHCAVEPVTPASLSLSQHK
ncbi:uncharacterized protein LOC118557856 [Fundulus heteroclitus]|uniref:uncharacterized protein LOC118557856 n=1 Tax=Fundulus heteroclitus TaxID=8078 RepID=UPI00165A7297|nr:uncharacterized protein LOC118557856 [Fundulus heteroclitus]